MLAAGALCSCRAHTKAEADGRFRFGLNDPDGVSFFVQAKNQKGSEGVNLIINPEQFPKLKHAPVSHLQLSATSTQESNMSDFIQKAEQRAQYDKDIRTVNLKEIVITANKVEKRDIERLKYSFNRFSDKTIYREDIEKRAATTISQLFSGISGGVFFRPRLLLSEKDSKQPLVVVDGTPLYWDEKDPVSSLDDININDVETIDIFKGIGAAVFGMRGANGVISITTKNGNSDISERIKTNTVSVTPLGYQKPVEFYAPKYDTPESKYTGNPDYRTTIYWKPNLVISDKRQASFDFYTADFPTTYSIVIEGLTSNGKIVRQVERIAVRD